MARNEFELSVRATFNFPLVSFSLSRPHSAKVCFTATAQFFAESTNRIPGPTTSSIKGASNG